MMLTEAVDAPQRFAHALDVIRVWRVSLATVAAENAHLESVLSQDETERARRYVFERDRRRFVIGRASLRFVLSGYLKTEPGQIVFRYGNHGKPSVADASEDIQFSMSHSHDMALIAIARGRDVGVDIEYIRPMTDWEQLLTANFSSREVMACRSLPSEEQQAAFFAGWTRKEAYVKARGVGLSMALDSFTVSMGSREPAAVLEVRDDPEEAARWGMANLAACPGYAGALVGEGTGWDYDYAEVVGRDLSCADQTAPR